MGVPPKKRARMASKSGANQAGPSGRMDSAADMHTHLNRQSSSGTGARGAQQAAAAAQRQRQPPARQGASSASDASDAQHSEATDSEATKTQLTPAKRRRPAHSEGETISALLRSGAKSLTSSPSLFAKLKAAAAAPAQQATSFSGRDVSMVDQADPGACPTTPAVTTAQSGDLLQLNYSTPYPLLYRRRRESMDDGAAGADGAATDGADAAGREACPAARGAGAAVAAALAAEASLPTPSSGPAKRGSAAKAAAPSCAWTPTHASLLDYLKEVSMDGSLFNSALNNAASNAAGTAVLAAAGAGGASNHSNALPSPPPLNTKGGLVSGPITQLLLQQHLPFKSQLFAGVDKAVAGASFIAPVGMPSAFNIALQAAANATSRPSSRGSSEWRRARRAPLAAPLAASQSPSASRAAPGALPCCICCPRPTHPAPV
jgi:hypothetical protein